jgi:hypothetical protein
MKLFNKLLLQPLTVDQPLLSFLFGPLSVVIYYMCSLSLRTKTCFTVSRNPRVSYLVVLTASSRSVEELVDRFLLFLVGVGRPLGLGLFHVPQMGC